MCFSRRTVNFVIAIVLGARAGFLFAAGARFLFEIRSPLPVFCITGGGIGHSELRPVRVKKLSPRREP